MKTKNVGETKSRNHLVKKITLRMHYNGDGAYDLSFFASDWQVQDGYFYATGAQAQRIHQARIGSGPDGTVGPVSWSMNGESISIINL